MTVDNTAASEEQGPDLVSVAPRLGFRVIFSRFWPEARPLRGYLVLALLLVALGPALATAMTWLFKVLIDTVMVPGDFRGFPRLAGAFVGLALLQGLVSFADYYLSAWMGERFVLELRARIFDHLHRLAPDFLERRSVGDVLARLTTDVAAIESLLLTSVLEACSYIFELLFFTVALFVLDWRLTVAALIGAPGVLLIAQLFSRRIQDASREKGRRAGGLSGVAEESLGNAALVRAYHRGEAERAKFARQNQAGFAAQMTAARLEAFFGPLSQIFEVTGVLLVIGLAGWELGHHRLTVGGLLAFVAYLSQMYIPIQGIGQLSNSIFTASASAERVIELLDQKPSIVETVTPTTLLNPLGELQFHDVSFTYPGAQRAALQALSFAVLPGQQTMIVGASGAGKTTIAKLLLRFYDPDSGYITLDGVDLRQLGLTDLYRNIAVVLQETLVFDASVRENITWGKPDATDQQIVDAATAADAHQFITDLPHGYDTRVGQRGRLLSGGQRQRLAIARAIIRDAPVLLLDEPTSELDAHSYSSILFPLRRLISARTTITISHNLLTVAEADQILFLHNGRLSGVGTHNELLASTPGYATLYHLSQLAQAGANPGPTGQTL